MRSLIVRSFLFFFLFCPSFLLWSQEELTLEDFKKLEDKEFSLAFPDSVVILKKAAVTRFDLFPKEKILLGLIDLSTFYLVKSDFEQGIDYAYQVLELAKEIDTPKSYEMAYAQLGEVYASFNKYDKALAYFEKAIKTPGDDTITDRFSSTLQGIASVYSGLEDYENAALYDARSLEINRKLGDSLSIQIDLDNLSSDYLNLNQLDIAFKYGSEGLEIANALGDLIGQMSLQLSLAEINLAMGDLEQSKVYAEKGVAIAEDLEFLESALAGYEMLYRSNQQLQNYKEALHYHLKATEIKDSINDQKQYDLLVEKDLTQQFKEKHLIDSLNIAKQAEIQTSIERGKTERNFSYLVAASILLLIIAIALYFVIRRNKVIVEQKESLAKEKSENELLLKEIHHRVKNNLQIISSLLDIQSRSGVDASTLEVLKDGQSRVLAMSLIHQRLYQSDGLADLDFQSYVDELFAQLQKSFATTAEISINSDAVKFDIDVAIPLGLILNELITNSFKHGLREGEKGEINIKLAPSETQEGVFFLNYSDSGSGLPEDIDLEEADSLGLRLIYGLTEQLFGETRYENKKFHITFSTQFE